MKEENFQRKARLQKFSVLLLLPSEAYYVRGEQNK